MSFSLLTAAHIPVEKFWYSNYLGILCDVIKWSWFMTLIKQKLPNV